MISGKGNRLDFPANLAITPTKPMEHALVVPSETVGEGNMPLLISSRDGEKFLAFASYAKSAVI